jgi:hypothetical protein
LFENELQAGREHLKILKKETLEMEEVEDFMQKKYSEIVSYAKVINSY